MQISFKMFPNAYLFSTVYKVSSNIAAPAVSTITTTATNIESETVHFFRISCCLCMNSSSHVMGKRNNKDEKSKYELIHAEEQCTTQNNNR